MTFGRRGYQVQRARCRSCQSRVAASASSSTDEKITLGKTAVPSFCIDSNSFRPSVSQLGISDCRQPAVDAHPLRMTSLATGIADASTLVSNPTADRPQRDPRPKWRNVWDGRCRVWRAADRVRALPRRA